LKGWLNVYASKLREDIKEPVLKDIVAALKEWRSYLPGFVSLEGRAMMKAPEKAGIANL